MITAFTAMSDCDLFEHIFNQFVVIAVLKAELCLVIESLMLVFAVDNVCSVGRR